jgi:hypothetical protein
MIGDLDVQCSFQHDLGYLRQQAVGTIDRGGRFGVGQQGIRRCGRQ